MCSLRWHRSDSRDQIMQDLWDTVQMVVLSKSNGEPLEDFSVFAVIMVDAFTEGLLFPRSCYTGFSSINLIISSFILMRQGLHYLHLTDVEMEVPRI